MSSGTKHYQTATMEELLANEVPAIIVDASIRYAAGLGRDWFRSTFPESKWNAKAYGGYFQHDTKPIVFGMKWFAGEPARRLNGAADEGFRDIWLSAGIASKEAAVSAAAHESYHAAFNSSERNAELVGRAAVHHYKYGTEFKFVRWGIKSLEAIRMPFDPKVHVLTFEDDAKGNCVDLWCYRADRRNGRGEPDWREINIP